MVEFIAALPDKARARHAHESVRTLPVVAGARVREWALVALGFLLVGLALRGATFGDPVIHIDEQFYLLVGDRMLHGAVPFVDIWDRKPVGLFLLFAAIRELGGSGILQYQLVALACVTATSLVIYALARQIAAPAGAWWAGVGYQLYLSAFFCFGGQAPVYYNLLVALSALGMCRVIQSRETRSLLWQGLGLMLLMGVAVQIKYTVVFEGAAFGLALMWRGRQLGWSKTQVVLAATLWAAAGLVATAVAWGWYIAIGHGPEFVQANFQSIFGRHEEFLGSLWRLTKETLAMLPAILCLFVAPRRLALYGGETPVALPFLRWWAFMAVLGFLVFGTWYDHYVAPLLVPLMVLCAPALGRPGRSRFYTQFLIGFGVIAAAAVTIYNTSHHGTRAQVDRLTAIVRDNMGNGCAYINEGDPVLYLNTGSCFVTHYVFPNHLNGMVDVNSLGVNVPAELHNIMEVRRPQVVVMSVKPSSMPVNWAGRNYMFQQLARDYDLAGWARVGWRGFLVYRLKGTGGSPAVSEKALAVPSSLN